MPINDSWTPFNPDRPGGRPRGSRNRLNRKFFTVLSEDFEEHGEATIARLRFQDPAAYVAVIAKLMPQKLEISTPTEGLSDDQLERMIALAELRVSAIQGEAKLLNVQDKPEILHNGYYPTDEQYQALSGPSEPLSHEKRDDTDVNSEGGGGPFRAMGPGTKNTPPTTPDTLRPENACQPDTKPITAGEPGILPGFEAKNPGPALQGEEHKSLSTAEDTTRKGEISTSYPAKSPESAPPLDLADIPGGNKRFRLDEKLKRAPDVVGEIIHPPVGRPKRAQGAEVKRATWRNKRALAEEDVDPASLF